MRAILSVSPGAPRSLVAADVEKPSPGPGEVRVRVQAVGINYPDLLIIDDRYQYRPQRPFSPGGEIAGIVDAVGEGVDEGLIGDRVLSFTGWGGLVEFACLPAAKCHKVPDAMPVAEAAAFILTYGTAHHALTHRGNLAAGDTVLVLGSAGGVGLAAVELAKALGATVIAAASTQSKLDVALMAGADRGVLYERGPLDRDGQKKLSLDFKAAVGKAGADIVFDAVGGSYAEPALRAIAWEGRYLVIGFPAGVPSIPLNLPLLKSCDLRGVFWGEWTSREPETYAREVEALFDLYLAGKIRPRIHKRFALEDSAAALEELASRDVAGKVIVTIDSN